MAGELQVQTQSSLNVYFTIRNSVGQIWNGSAMEAYSTGNYANYPVTATEQGSASGFYTATFPAAITPGVYSIVAYSRLGGSPAESDTVVATGDFQWNGTATAPLSDTSTSGQVGLIAPLRIARGTMVSAFPIPLVSSADGVTPFTSGVVSGQISRDGGSFGPLQSGAFSEIGLGWYHTVLTSGDLLANTVALNFTAVGISGGSSNPYKVALVLQRTSGQT